MREVPDSVVRGIMDPFVSPRGGKFQRPQIKASWLRDPAPAEDHKIMSSSAVHESELIPVSGLKHARLVGRADARSHSQPGAFALTGASELNLRRPGSARVEITRKGNPASRFSRPRSAVKKWCGNLSRPDDPDSQDRKQAEHVHFVHMPEELKDPDRRKMRRGRFSLADRLNSRASILTEGCTKSMRAPDDKQRAQIAHSVMIWQRVMTQRMWSERDRLTPGMMKKLHPTASKKSMFESCLKNPHGYGWPRPESAEGFTDATSSDGCCLSQLDSRCTSPAIEDVQSRLALDATRFEKKYNCPSQLDRLSLYRGPSSRSPSPPVSRIASPSDHLRDPAIQACGVLEWRPETPHLNYEEDVVLTVEQPGPPSNLDSHGSYHVEQRPPNLLPPYTTASLELTNHSEQCPKFNVSTIRRWFDIVSLGNGVVRRRQLILALNENEDIFCVFCGAELHKHIRSVEKTEGKRSAWNKWKLTEASFDLRVMMLRRGLEVLDRIDWEWKQCHKDTRESRGRRSLSKGSMSRKLAFEVFLTYFKYMDMLLECNDTENLNWNWSVFRSKDIAKGMSPEEFTRISMEALGSPTPPEDDDLDEDVIKDASDARRAFSGFRRRV